MMNELEKFEVKKLSRNPAIGMAVIGRFSEDQALYRAVVCNVYEDSCQLMFVDFGNTEVVKMHNIYDIPPQFLKDKTYAIGFCLSKINTINYQAEFDKIFQDIVLDRELKMHVVPIEMPTFIQYCELTYDNPSKNVFDQIVMRTKPAPLRYPPAIQFSKDSTETVVIRYVESAKKLFVQLKKDDEIFDKIDTELNTSKEEENLKEPLKAFEIGGPCAVYYRQYWYRAEIVGLKLPKVKVRVIDFGHIYETEKEFLRCLPSSLINYEPLVIPCCLLGFENVDNDETTVSQIEMLAEDNNGLRNYLQMHVLEKRDHYYVINLFDATKTPILDFSRQLLRLKKNPLSFMKQSKHATPVNSTLINESIQQGDSVDSIVFSSMEMSESETETPMNDNRLSTPKRVLRPDQPRFNVR
jgi:tudor domain-containing protein 1/4/6/7